VSRRLVNITLDNLGDLSPRCRSCVFWELDPVAGERACEMGGTDLEKEAWVSDTLLEWGSCGKLAYVDSAPAGFVLFAPPAYVPRSVAFPTSPVSPDAVLLMTARVQPEFAGAGLGRMLVQAVVGDVARRGLKAVEAFGTHAEQDDKHACVLPSDYLLAVGFKTVRPHPKFPRLRLDVKSTVSWKEDVEYAIDRLFASITPTPSAVSRS
jgi:GNAT superfamily N-acetyltransferase